MPIDDCTAAAQPPPALSRRGASLRSNNNKHSGGFPHSEIHGSKLVLSSPWLIAEYHVFHRLLLPRHPPNALFALDLIQKKSDFLLEPNAFYYPSATWFVLHLLFWLVYLT